MLPKTLTKPAYSNLHGLRMISAFHAFLVKRASSTTGVTSNSEISISAFSISKSISQLFFIDISISAISMTALAYTIYMYIIDIQPCFHACRKMMKIVLPVHFSCFTTNSNVTQNKAQLHCVRRLNKYINLLQEAIYLNSYGCFDLHVF